jgi:protein YibB
MASLDNDMVIYTSKEFAETISQYRKDKKNTNIIIVDFPEVFDHTRELISDVQSQIKFQNKINVNQRKNPEYWNADYVLINFLKSHFVCSAIKGELIDTDMVAWMDFGYCRSPSTLCGIPEWNVNLSEDKIHVFSIKDWIDGTFIQDVIFNNDVHITGPHIIASKKMWPLLDHMVVTHMEFLLNNNLVDDDQTLLLMCTLSNPTLFDVHKVSSDDWFVMFKDYNDIAS